MLLSFKITKSDAKNQKSFRYDPSQKLWLARSDQHEDFLAVSNSLLGLGSSEWRVYNDSRRCDTSGSYSRMMTLSVCSESEFTCASGDCVDMRLRCDRSKDCEDGSDEDMCQVIRDPVPQVSSAPAVNNEKLVVNISLLITNILYINEVENFFKASILFKKSWFNHLLTYQNLKQGQVNHLGEEEPDVWTPYAGVLNMENKDKCTAMDSRTLFAVVTDPDFVYEHSDPSLHQNSHLFPGSRSPMIHEQGYTCEFICQFDYHWYPWDHQNCQIRLNASSMEVVLYSEIIDYVGQTDLLQYSFKELHHCSSDKLGRSGLFIDITFQRQKTSNLLTTFLPTGQNISPIFFINEKY